MKKYARRALMVSVVSLAVVYPVLKLIAYIERGYWAVGGEELLAVFFMVVVPVMILEHGKEVIRKKGDGTK